MTNISRKEIEKLIHYSSNGVNGYEGNSKQDFHSLGKKYLKVIAAMLGLEKNQFNIRSNKAGPAVSGEIVLHADHLYVQISAATYLNNNIFYRHCESQKDYSGGTNHWLSYNDLLDLYKVVNLFKKTMQYGA